MIITINNINNGNHYYTSLKKSKRRYWTDDFSRVDVIPYVCLLIPASQVEYRKVQCSDRCNFHINKRRYHTNDF